MAGVSLTYKDYDNEKSVSRFEGPTITNITFEAQDALIDALVAAVAAVTIGNKVTETRIYENVPLADTPASDKYAHRETKWLITGHGPNAPFQKFRWEIPCAKLSLLDDHESDLPLDGTEGAALVSAIQAYVKDDNGDAVVVDRITHVGRNT